MLSIAVPTLADQGRRQLICGSIIFAHLLEIEVLKTLLGSFGNTSGPVWDPNRSFKKVGSESITTPSMSKMAARILSRSSFICRLFVDVDGIAKQRGFRRLNSQRWAIPVKSFLTSDDPFVAAVNRNLRSRCLGEARTTQFCNDLSDVPACDLGPEDIVRFVLLD